MHMRVAVKNHALPVFKKNRIALLLFIFETIICVQGIPMCVNILYFNYDWLYAKMIVLSEIKENNNMDQNMKFWYLLYC